jgi:Fic family protein
VTGTWVPRRWAATVSTLGGRRSRTPFTFEAFIPNPLRDREFLFSGETVADIVDAERAIAVANYRPTLVGMEALGRMLLRSESMASSRIEGLVCGQRRLAEAAFDPVAGTEVARTVLANLDAMRQAVELGSSNRALSVADVLAMHRTLLEHDRRPGLNVGKIREQQNWIGGRHDSPRGAAYVPPPPEEVPALLEDLVAFANRDDLPAVAQAAIVHAQFETIHPFADGNGRVGRCLIQVVLVRRVMTSPILAPISLVLAARGKTYIGGLVDFREGRVDEWCATFAVATSTAMEYEAAFDRLLHGHIEHWQRESRARKGSILERACERINVVPVFNVETLRAELGCSTQAASDVIDRLAGVGAVRSVSLGKRSRVWINTSVLDLLDDFEHELLANSEPEL